MEDKIIKGGPSFVIYDDCGLWLKSMQGDGPDVGGCGVWTSLKSQARKMSRKEAHSLCAELLERAGDSREWAIGVEAADEP